MIKRLRDSITQLFAARTIKAKLKNIWPAKNERAPSFPQASVPTLDITLARRVFTTRYRSVTTNGDVSIYSFRNKPSIVLELKSSTSSEDPDLAKSQLPPGGTTHELEDGTVIVGVGGVGRSTKAIVSNSFSSCTPLIAKFADGSVGLYHAAWAANIDPKREYLLAARPVDIFVITKDGEGAHTGRQTAQAIDVVDQAFPETNVHIVAMPRATLSVEARPEKIVIRHMPIRRHARDSDDRATGQPSCSARNALAEHENGPKDICEIHTQRNNRPPYQARNGGDGRNQRGSCR